MKAYFETKLWREIRIGRIVFGKYSSETLLNQIHAIDVLERILREGFIDTDDYQKIKGEILSHMLEPDLVLVPSNVCRIISELIDIHINPWNTSTD